MKHRNGFVSNSSSSSFIISLERRPENLVDMCDLLFEVPKRELYDKELKALSNMLDSIQKQPHLDYRKIISEIEYLEPCDSPIIDKLRQDFYETDPTDAEEEEFISNLKEMRKEEIKEFLDNSSVLISICADVPDIELHTLPSWLGVTGYEMKKDIPHLFFSDTLKGAMDFLNWQEWD